MTRSDAEPQLALPFAPAPAARCQDFVPAASNALARHWLDHPADWPDRRLALFGPAGCGKTHLARCWLGGEGLWLDGAALPPLSRFDQRRVVIDRADTGSDARALLHWLNACTELGLPVVLTGRTSPAFWRFDLADLASRLRAVQAIGIDPPEDGLLHAVLARMLAERQLSVPGAVQAWLVLHLPRTAWALQQAVATLDSSSLAHRAPLTGPFVRARLAELLDETEGK